MWIVIDAQAHFSGGRALAIAARLTVRLLILGAGQLAATACAGPGAYDVLTSHRARIAVERQPGREAVALRVNATKAQPIPGLTDARVRLVWSADKSDFVVLEGTTATCASMMWLAVVTDSKVSLHQLGYCGHDIVFEERGDMLVVRRTQARGNASATVYPDGGSTGPYVLAGHSGVLPRQRTVAAPRPWSVRDRNDDPQQDAPSLSPGVTLNVPAVSTRVGDDVLPEPVGAGPLPPGAGAPVLPFTLPPQTNDPGTSPHDASGEGRSSTLLSTWYHPFTR